MEGPAPFCEWGYGVPPVNVVGRGYCVPYPLELIVKKKIKKLSNAQFEVFDQVGNLLLQVDGSVWNLQMRRTVRDPAGFPILTLKGKALTFWHKWKAHEGEGINGDENILFSVRQSHPLQIKKELHVHLADIKTNAPDFRVSGSYTSLSFKVFQGRRLIAEVNKSLHSCISPNRVKVYPEVDYAFIIALLVTLDENDTP